MSGHQLGIESLPTRPDDLLAGGTCGGVWTAEVHKVTDYYGADPDELTVAEGSVPADVAKSLASHPEAIEELRQRYGQ